MAAILCAIVTGAAATVVPSFQELGDLPDGVTSPSANGVSADGTVIVGRWFSASGPEAFRWTEGMGMQGLGFVPAASSSSAWAVSADGSVIVGSSGDQAFRWTMASGMQPLGVLSGDIGDRYSYATGVSADGSVIVGSSSSSSGRQAFRWTQPTGMVGLGDLPTGVFPTEALGISADGAVIVGYSDSGSNIQAFRWTTATGTVGLGKIPGAPATSAALNAAYAASADGSVIVGRSDSASGQIAFRWTEPTGMVGLGDLPGSIDFGVAYAVSTDGSVVVGASATTPITITEAFIWDEGHGMRNLKEFLLHSNPSLDLSNWWLSAATGISADGTVIVGIGGIGGEPPFGGSPLDTAWRVVIPEPWGLPLLASFALALPVRRRRSCGPVISHERFQRRPIPR